MRGGGSCGVSTNESSCAHGAQINFMYLRAILCSFQISVDFYYVPVGGRGGGRGRLEKGGGAREMGIECTYTVWVGYS
jgi:hypothetical protein